VVVQATPALLAAELRPGDLLRWNPDASIASEKMTRSQDSAFLLNDPPNVSFADIGGLDEQVRRMLEALEIHWRDPKAARLFHLPRKGSVLLVGPAGNGKTMIGKALARQLGEWSGAGPVRFMNIKPGACSLHASFAARQFCRPRA
jgi:proteasome-associated ATPase